MLVLWMPLDICCSYPRDGQHHCVKHSAGLLAKTNPF